MSFAYPAFGSTHVERMASNSLIVEYSRNPDKFALSKYCQYVPVDVSTDLYLVIDPDAASRIPNIDEFIWPDGQDAPKGDDNMDGFEFLNYRTERYAPAFSFGLKASTEADWDIVAQHARSKVQQAMTLRTMRAVALLNTSGNFGSNSSTATALGGGLWGSATSTTPYIQASILNAVSAIVIATNSRVNIDEMCLVLSPSAAITMSQTDEIRNYVKSSPFSEPVLEGQGRTKQYGLPASLYGVDVICEDAVANTAKRGAARNAGYAFDSNQAVLVSRPGGLEGIGGAPSFSTLTMFSKEEINVETMTDTWNRKVHGRVTDDNDLRLTAPAAGYCITNLFS